MVPPVGIELGTSVILVSGQSSLEVTFPCWNFLLKVLKPLMLILPLSSSF